MKKIFCLAAVLAVAACNDTASEAPVAEDTAAVAEAPAATPVSMGVDGQPSTGKFKVTGPDNTTYDYDVKEDGTYTSVSSTGDTVNGTWTEATPGKWCETPEGGTETCSTEAIDASGKWTATNDGDGTVYTVERVAS